jgi:putative ATP-dependent endonuclease of OLD family
LTEVFDRFLGEQTGHLRLEDFSAATRPKFLAAKALRDGGEVPPEKILA